MSQNQKPNDGIGVRDLIVAEQHVSDVSETALAVYENRDVVRELVARMMMFHPAAAEVGERGMLQAAQLALTMGASPFPGMNEIHVYENRGKIIVQAGINYWLRRSLYFGGVRWRDHVRPMTIDEVDLYQIDVGLFLSAICSGVRAREFRQRAIENKELGLTETPAELMRSMLIVGLGVTGRAQYTNNNKVDYKERKQGRPLIWTAQKRAETDFYKKAFPFIPGERVPAGAGLRLLAEPDGDIRYAPNTESREWNHAEPSRHWTVEHPDDPPAAGFDVAEINAELGLAEPPSTVPVPAENIVEIPKSETPVVVPGQPAEADPTFDYYDPEFDPNVDGDDNPADDGTKQPSLFNGEGGSK